MRKNEIQYEAEIEHDVMKRSDCSYLYDLTNGLFAGFVEQQHAAKQEYIPKLILNDKKNGRCVLHALQKALKNCDEFWISVAFLTMGGVIVFINLLKELEQKGVKGKLLVSQYQNFTQPQALRKLLEFHNIQLRIAVEGNFHAKSYIFKNKDEYRLIIGSSNLTAQALRENKEWNLEVTSTGKGSILQEALKEFQQEFDRAQIVDGAFIEAYERIFTLQRNVETFKQKQFASIQSRVIKPNIMQREALKNLRDLRNKGKKRALIISATGTGKTYLSAFDVKEVNPQKFLFIVHRETIAKKSMESYKKILGNTKTYGMYTGKHKEVQKDYIFSTIQTLAIDQNLDQFDQRHFDYIVIDETHRAGAVTYQKVVNHFKPNFLLGMTATPERMDGYDIFNEFNYNIAYEIRLHRALEEKLLCDFHYFGITDITVGGDLISENDTFQRLTATERVNHIIEKAAFYGCDHTPIRGLVFCSSIKESEFLSRAFNSRGYRSVSLSGKDSEADRSTAISLLEDDRENHLDYIFTVDIFNEGIDIPKVNQIIMLRPTQSAIIFVQQLGRGLRKAKNKDYVTVLDFIGNYKKNYLIPIALYGNTSYNKDTLRKLLVSGSASIPGTSTINFDKIAHERIFASINKASMQTKRELVDDYQLLKYKIGKIPMMVDFLKHGSRDPQLYVQYAKSYYNFVVDQEKIPDSLGKKEIKLLELFSNEIANTKRIEEVIILKELLRRDFIETSSLRAIMEKNYGVLVSDNTLQSCLRNINFEFVTESENNKLCSVREKYKYNIVKYQDDKFLFMDDMKKLLNNITFLDFFRDLLDYARLEYDRVFDQEKYCDGFILYRKYARKDVFRILNWLQNPVAQNVGGYIVSKDKSNCPLFVNYHKDENISDTTKYIEGFVSKYKFEWMSKSKRTIQSPDMQAIQDYKKGLRIPLFIKKSNAESNDFYYMGDVEPILESIAQTSMPSDSKVSVVKMVFMMKHPVEDPIYEYLTKAGL